MPIMILFIRCSCWRDTVAKTMVLVSVFQMRRAKKEMLVVITRRCGGCWLISVRRWGVALQKGAKRRGSFKGVSRLRERFLSHVHIPSSVVILTKWEYYLNSVLYFAGVFDMFKKCKAISSVDICLHLALIHTLGGSKYSVALFCVF